MDVQITSDDVQAVLNVDPILALKVQNRALLRHLEATNLAFETAMKENARLTDELEKAKNGHGQKGR